MSGGLARVRDVLGDAQRRRQALHLRQEVQPTLQHRIHAALPGEVQVRVQVALALPEAQQVPRRYVPLHEFLEQVVERRVGVRDQ